jgi:hypothetical protein
MDSSHGAIRLPIETDLQFQRAFSPSFDRLPYVTPLFQRAPLCIAIGHQSIEEICEPREYHAVRGIFASSAGETFSTRYG